MCLAVPMSRRFLAFPPFAYSRLSPAPSRLSARLGTTPRDCSRPIASYRSKIVKPRPPLCGNSFVTATSPPRPRGTVGGRFTPATHVLIAYGNCSRFSENSAQRKRHRAPIKAMHPNKWSRHEDCLLLIQPGVILLEWRGDLLSRLAQS